MRVLAHIHTFNDADVIEQALEGLQRQTRQPDAIVIVDNASTDATLDRTFPEQVAIVRNPMNLGTSGAIRAGFAHGLEHGFDWVWIFDADSVAEPDALENLLAFFARLPPSAQEQVCFLGCQATASGGEDKDQQMIFEGSGGKPVLPEVDAGYSRCDCAIWSGSLYRMSAVEKIGLPSADYVLDWAELEYGYRARQLGFTSYTVHGGVLHHDVGRRPGMVPHQYQLGPLKFQFDELSPIRCYYHVRNLIYFWLYQFKPRGLSRIVRNIGRSVVFTMTFVVRPVSHRRQLIACLRGLWDGLTMHMERRH
jgi:rhamnopyranosyl-N-acetylglucosaminyl-diphospho-decaprenol beta-1,3/1,4-galactofuranosyltransferase